MNAEIAPVGLHTWGGINKRQDASALPPGVSPDTWNTFLYAGNMGLLGPRLGKTFSSIAPGTIVNCFPYHIGGQNGVLAALADGRTVFLNGSSLVPGGELVNVFVGMAMQGGGNIAAGPVIIQVNQAGQVVNVIFNGGTDGLNGSFCVEDDVDTTTCEKEYAVIYVQNGIIVGYQNGFTTRQANTGDFA